MPRIDNEQFYLNALKKHGISSCGLNWSSDAHQYIRFEKILELLLQNQFNEETLVDAGCGFGDFYRFLQNNDITPKQYKGIDTLKEMCEIAQNNTQCEIIHADITTAQLPLADYYICSGALNILTPFESELFIRNCFYASKKGFIFNVLYGNKQSKIYNYLTKESIESLAERLHVREIQLKEDYLENDITVGFLK